MVAILPDFLNHFFGAVPISIIIAIALCAALITVASTWGLIQKLAKRWDIFYVFKRHTLKRNQARVDKKNLTIRMIFALILAIGMALVAYYVLNMVQVSSIIIMATISVVFILAFIKSPTWAISVLGAAYAAYGLSQELWAGIQHLFPNLTSLQHHAMQALVVISGVAIFLMTFQCILKCSIK